MPPAQNAQHVKLRCGIAVFRRMQKRLVLCGTVHRNLLVGNGDESCRRERRVHRIEVADLADSEERLVFELYST